jgi:hypothetical protein
MNNDHLHPPSSTIHPKIRDLVNLETVTVRELGDVARLYGLKLEDVLTL